MPPKKTYVYIDGFNLYYGSLKRTPYKWLNVHRMCELLLTQNKIDRIYYFTAQVSGTPSNPDSPQRQLAYIRALRTIPILQIVQGHFLVDRVFLRKADDSGDVEVIRMKEKQSDVNLASQLLWDAHCNSFECAVLISGDSDFLSPVQIVKERFRKDVGILDPQRSGTPNSPLNKMATFYKPIRQGVLHESQFPMSLTDKTGTFYKPESWFAEPSRP